MGTLAVTVGFQGKVTAHEQWGPSVLGSLSYVEGALLETIFTHKYIKQQ